MLLVQQLLILFLLLGVVGKSASVALRRAIALSRFFGLSELFISLIVVTAISILPETMIAILAALRGVPSLGLGTLLGSDVADLTFVFGMMAIFARHHLKARGVILKKDYLFLSFLLLPLMLGFTGYFSRLDGVLLIAGGILFFTLMTRGRVHTRRPEEYQSHPLLLTISILAASLLVLGFAAYAAVSFAQQFAQQFGVNPALIGLVIVALGTTLPELLFSIRAVQKNHATLALGDVLGTVVADATLVLGITALIRPFSFNPRLIILTGSFMLLASLFLFSLLRTGRELTKSEGVLLLVFYALFVIIEFILRDWTPLIRIF